MKTTTTFRRLYDADWWRVFILFALTLLAKYLFGGFVFLFVVTDQSTAQEKIDRSIFSDGEVLQYRVRWGFIRLGTLVLRQDKIDSTHYVCTLFAESNPNLPFIDIFFVNRAILSPFSLVGSEFISAIGRTTPHVINHRRDPDRGRIFFSEMMDGTVLREDTVITDEDIYDELGLILSARFLAGSGKRKTFHTAMEYKITQTEMNFPERKETIEVPAFPNAVAAYLFEVKADWTRPDYAGLSGNFKGWISDDSAAVLLRVDVKIFLGSVVLELESFNRLDWKHSVVKLVNNLY